MSDDKGGGQKTEIKGYGIMIKLEVLGCSRKQGVR
jgi:hypothetical protein